MGRRNVEPRDMYGGNRTNKRACTTQKLTDLTSWHVGLAQEMVNDTCEGARTVDLEAAGRLRGRVGDGGPKGSSASREGCGLAKAESRISNRGPRYPRATQSLQSQPSRSSYCRRAKVANLAHRSKHRTSRCDCAVIPHRRSLGPHARSRQSGIDIMTLARVTQTA